MCPTWEEWFIYHLGSMFYFIKLWTYLETPQNVNLIIRGLVEKFYLLPRNYIDVCGIVLEICMDML